MLRFTHVSKGLNMLCAWLQIIADDYLISRELADKLDEGIVKERT